jgi:hypothetical protein
MSEIAELFTRTSNTLRDNVVIELKKSNDFLRNQLSKQNSNPLFGYKVIIESHPINMASDMFHETRGILLDIKGSSATILYKNENNQNKVKLFHLNNVTIDDERIENYYL